MYYENAPIEIIGGDYAGLGGVIVETRDTTCVVLLGTQLSVTVAFCDIALELSAAARLALDELCRVEANIEVIVALSVALSAHRG